MPVLLFHGDNYLEIDDTVHTLRARFQPADVLMLEGATVSLPALTEACLTAGLFAPERLVLVHDLHKRIKGPTRESGELDEITAVLRAVPETTTAVMVERDMPADHTLLRAARGAGVEVRSFAAPRKQDLPRWIRSRARQHSVAIDGGAADVLADLVGSNPIMLDTELEKLATYAGEEGRITLAMVELLVGAVPQDSIFALVDAIAAGDRRQAFRLLHEQLDRASGTPIDFALYLIRMLARQIRILLRIQLGREAGRAQSQIVSDLKLPRFYADRYFKQAGRLPRQRLVAAFEDLAALEQALKTGKSRAEPGLDLLLSTLCA